MFSFACEGARERVWSCAAGDAIVSSLSLCSRRRRSLLSDGLYQDQCTVLGTACPPTSRQRALQAPTPGQLRVLTTDVAAPQVFLWQPTAAAAVARLTCRLHDARVARSAGRLHSARSLSAENTPKKIFLFFIDVRS